MNLLQTSNEYNNKKTKNKIKKLNSLQIFKKIYTKKKKFGEKTNKINKNHLEVELHHYYIWELKKYKNHHQLDQPQIQFYKVLRFQLFVNQ